MITNKTIGGLIKKTVGFAPNRSLPTLHHQTLAAWFAKHPKPNSNSGRKVYLFCDEFTNYNDTEIGIKAILLLEKLGYEVSIPKHVESGRASMSKGLIRDAKKFANTNVELLSSIVSDDQLLIGIEPSAILCFRDEYPDLVDDHLLESSKQLAKRALLIDEFLAQEMTKGNIQTTQFTQTKKSIQLHGHCQQKSVASMDSSLQILAAPANYQVSLIPSGCCGMAGSFGYEKEHFELSQQISELVLLPTIRKQPEEVIIAATGTSCRHQIKDGLAIKAKHPVEILYEALA
jgi:Fe-S oxidoreductase